MLVTFLKCTIVYYILRGKVFDFCPKMCLKQWFSHCKWVL